jgi:hypothetical protein
MAHAYTPGLTVTEQARIRRRRLLPIAGTVIVQVGEQVTAKQVVAQTSLPGKVYPVNVANQLGIAPDEILHYLTRRVGDPVEKDDIIAENKPLLKWLKTEIPSPIRGTVDSVSPITGQILLREPPLVLDLLAYLDGTVAEVHGNEGVIIEATCSLVQGIFGVGGETWGPIVMGVSSPDDPLSPDRLRPSMKGCVVVGGSFLSYETMTHAKELGIIGLVVGGVHDKDIRTLLGYDLGVAITGTERIGFTLILTEGFGTIPMATRTFDLLSKYAGRQASVSGATQIRAGVIRPEIIIAQTSGDGARNGTASSAPKEGIQTGDHVRIIRDPLFGRIGEVSALPPEPYTIATESQVRVLGVRFPDGQETLIPRSNIEVIEG